MYSLIDETINGSFLVKIEAGSDRSRFIKNYLKSFIDSTFCSENYITRFSQYMSSGPKWSELEEQHIKIALCYRTNYYFFPDHYYILIQLSKYSNCWTNAHQQALKEKLEPKITNTYGSFLSSPCTFYRFGGYQVPCFTERDVTNARLFTEDQNILAITFENEVRFNQFLQSKDFQMESEHCIIL